MAIMHYLKTVWSRLLRRELCVVELRGHAGSKTAADSGRKDSMLKGSHSL